MRRPVANQPPGKYYIRDTLFIGHHPDGSPPDGTYNGLILRGSAPTAGGGLPTPAAIIITNFDVDSLNRPAINIQGARDVQIENLVIRGQNDILNPSITAPQDYPIRTKNLQQKRTNS